MDKYIHHIGNIQVKRNNDKLIITDIKNYYCCNMVCVTNKLILIVK